MYLTRDDKERLAKALMCYKEEIHADFGDLKESYPEDSDEEYWKIELFEIDELAGRIGLSDEYYKRE